MGVAIAVGEQALFPRGHGANDRDGGGGSDPLVRALQLVERLTLLGASARERHMKRICLLIAMIASALFALPAAAQVLPPVPAATQPGRAANNPFVGQAISDKSLTAAQALCNGRQIDIRQIWCAVPEQTFSGTWLPAVKEADANGSTVHLTLQPKFAGCLQQINSGKLDTYFETFAREVGAYGKLIYIRPMQEVNLSAADWTWSDQPPADFISAFQRIVGFFRKYAPNAKIEWNLANTNAGKHTFSEFNPGAEYYDYAGMDGYNWGTSRDWSKWQSFDQVFSSVYAYLLTLDKPIIISEYGCAKEGGDKNAWLADALNQVRHSGKYDRVFMMIYFDVPYGPEWFDIDSGGREGYNKAIAFPARQP